MLIVEQQLGELRVTPGNPSLEIMAMRDFAILKLLNHVQSQYFFSWDGMLFKQTSGLPMGGRLSPILAILYLEHIEYEVLHTSM